MGKCLLEKTEMQRRCDDWETKVIIVMTRMIMDGGDSSQGVWCLKKAISNEVLKMNGESGEPIKNVFLFSSEKVGSRILHSK